MKKEKKCNVEENEEMKNNNAPVKTFFLGDDFHCFEQNDEIIEFIGERIRALENLEKCLGLKVFTIN